MKRKFRLVFILTALLLIASNIVSAIMLSDYSSRKFIIALVPAIIFSAVFIIQVFLLQRQSLRHIAELNESVNSAENKSLYNFDNPIVIIDSENTVLWCNREFELQIMGSKEAFGNSINKIININFNINELLTNRVVKAEYNKRIYKINAVPVYDHVKTMAYLNFTDITEFAELLGRYKRTRPTVTLLVIDNYEEVLQNSKESEKAQVSASIQTIIEEFMANTTGVIRKLGNDKFIAIVEEQHLSGIIAAKFDILDKARNITVGDKNNIITFSIGVGRGGETLEENEIYAKQALDMCMGRGGDQAAVKTDNGFRFFGGISKGVEKKSKAKSRIISNALQEIINTSDDVYIMGHKFADLDAVGAGVGLAAAINMIGKKAYFVVDFQKNLSEMLIEKVLSEFSELIITTENAESDFGENSLLVIVDTHNAELAESHKLIKKANQKVVIDHHRKTVNFINDAVIFHHEPYASSASEMVTEIIQYFKNVNTIPQVIAEALLSGIMLDTKNFVMRTGVRTFEAAAYLRKNGADTVKVKSLFTSSIEAYKKKSALIASAELKNRCAIAVAEKEINDIRKIAPQAADELLGIKDVDASFVIYKTGSITNISARSLGLMNVQVVMEKLGGGGHQTMAAVQLDNIPPLKAKELLIKAIKSD